MTDESINVAPKTTIFHSPISRVTNMIRSARVEVYFSARTEYMLGNPKNMREQMRPTTLVKVRQEIEAT